jgi:hypothetical protein
MSKPYKLPVIRASPDLKISEPGISKLAILIAGLFGRLYLFLFFGIAKIVLRGAEPLFESCRRALAGESRCIIAFRHTDGCEPQLLAWFILFRLRRLAALKGIRFARPPHAIFVYGYEVIRWGGWITRAVLSHIGALPVHHAKMDSPGMARIYRALLEGPYPLALAPEGQVSYASGPAPRLESGVIRIGFGAAEKLADSEKPLPLEILPVSFHFRYGNRGKSGLEALLKKIEKFTAKTSRGPEKPNFRERLRACRDHILVVNEKRYGLGAVGPFEERLEKVIVAALEAAERILGQKAEGDHFSRMYYLRHICWDRIILPGTASLDHLSRVQRGAADLAAGEAWHAGRHLELADFCWYFRIPLPEEDAPLHQKIEYARNLWDFASRTMGGAYADRIVGFSRTVIIRSAPPIDLSERLPAYKADKKSTVNGALADLLKAFLDCAEVQNEVEEGRINA